jgi:type II secretory pathway predicted ATPase ExeA
MYEHHFGLTRKPFSLSNDPEFVMLGEQHGMAMTLLEYALSDQTGFTVITGEVGCGKTTLTWRLFHDAQGRFTIGVINDTVDFGDQLLGRMLLAFDQVPSESGRIAQSKQFSDFAKLSVSRGQRPILIVDEAQNLGAATLEELRVLSNLNDENGLLMQLILLGQPELLTTLRQAGLRQFRQRVAVHYHLEPLSAGEAHQYIRHRVIVAGGDPNLFDEAAREMVCDHSGGVPRLINVICDMALVYAFGRGQEQVTASIVRRVIDDRRQSQLFGSSTDGPGLDALDPDQSESPSPGPRASGTPHGRGDLAGLEPFPVLSRGDDLEAYPFPLAVLQAGRHVLANSAYARVFGHRSPQRLIDRSAVDLVLPEDRDIVASLLWRCEFDQFGHGTVTVRSADGAGGEQMIELTVQCAVLEGRSAASLIPQPVSAPHSASVRSGPMLVRDSS